MCDLPDQDLDSQWRIPSLSQATDTSRSGNFKSSAPLPESNDIAQHKASKINSSLVLTEDVEHDQWQPNQTYVAGTSHQASEYSLNFGEPSEKTVSTSKSQRKARKKLFKEHEERILGADPFAALLVEEAIEDSEKMRRLLERRAAGQLKATDPGPDADLIHLHWSYNFGGWEEAVRVARWRILKRADRRLEEFRAEVIRYALETRVNQWLRACVDSQEISSVRGAGHLASD